MPDIDQEQRTALLLELSTVLGTEVTKLKLRTPLAKSVGGVDVTVTRYPLYYEIALKQGQLSGTISIYANQADTDLYGAEGVRLAHAVREHVPKLLSALLGEEKAKWLSEYVTREEPATIPLTGFGGVEVENHALSLECPPGLFAVMEAAATTLLQTPTGKKIVQLANSKGVCFTVFYQKGKFNYGCDSDDPGKPVDRGKFFADPAAIESRPSYKGVGKPTNETYPLENAPIRTAVVFGHEVVHAIHSMVSWADYLKRGATATDDDWDDLEEQLTITGWVEGEKPWEVSECHLLHDLGLPPRWGHGDTTTIARQSVSLAQVAKRYGPHWGKSYAV
jgi:hypothetical protein